MAVRVQHLYHYAPVVYLLYKLILITVRLYCTYTCTVQVDYGTQLTNDDDGSLRYLYCRTGRIILIIYRRLTVSQYLYSYRYCTCTFVRYLYNISILYIWISVQVRVRYVPVRTRTVLVLYLYCSYCTSTVLYLQKY